jgi:cyanate permease
MITTCANAIGPALMGFLYERAGGYEVPYLAIAASSLIGITALTAAGPVRAMIDKR